MSVDEMIDFVFWCAAQVLELAGIGPYSQWASHTANKLRAQAQASRRYWDEA